MTLILTATLSDMDEWKQSAACRGAPEATFFAELHAPVGDPYKEAREICSTCIVQKTCLDYALATETYRHGFWGGMNPNEREREYKKRTGKRRAGRRA